MPLGDRVRIVPRARNWTAYEIELYGDRTGTVAGVSAYEHDKRKWLVQIDTGPCAGECRWFSSAEIAETLELEP